MLRVTNAANVAGDGTLTDNTVALIVNQVAAQKGADSNAFALAIGRIMQALEPLDAVTRPIVEYESIQQSLQRMGELEEQLKVA